MVGLDVLTSPIVRIDKGGQRSLEVPWDYAETLNVDVIPEAHARALAEAGIDALRSKASHQLLRFLVRKVHEQSHRQVSNYRTIEVDSYKDLCKQAGISTTSKSVKKVTQILHAFRCVDLHVLDHVEQVLSMRLQKGKRGLTLKAITVTELLAPRFVVQFNDRKLSKYNEVRKLVPLTGLPPLIGRSNEHGSQCSLSMRIVIEMRYQSVECWEKGGIIITIDRWLELARNAGVPQKLAPSLLGLWLTGDKETPAFLKQVGPDRYALGDSEKDAWQFILSGAERSRLQKINGKRAVQKRLRSANKGARGAPNTK